MKNKLKSIKSDMIKFDINDEDLVLKQNTKRKEDSYIEIINPILSLEALPDNN